MIRELNIKVGKTYSINHLIEELKQHPDIKLGHIYVLNKHEYRSGIEELEELKKRINKAERENVVVYDLNGRRKISPSDITVLGIIDPYSKYEKYEKFYGDLYKEIDAAISASDSGIVMAPSDDIVAEARKEGFAIEKDEHLLDGIRIFFERKGMESRHITKGKEGERKEYVVFGKEGSIAKEEKLEKKGDDKGRLITTTEYDINILKENTKEFESFYNDLETTVVVFIKQSKEGNAAVEISNIVEEAKKTIVNINNKKDLFLRGLVQYFNEKGISTDLRKADYMIFRTK